jgi:amino-acid N-acetyltransferase
MSPDTNEIAIRPSQVHDAPEIAAFIEPFVELRILLRRTLDELRDLTRNGFVAEAKGRIVGFAAVEVYSRKLAELQCLAVAADCQGRGVGKRLVQACVETARRHEVQELMAITAADEFFKDCGFDYSLPDQKKAVFINTRPRT